MKNGDPMNVVQGRIQSIDFISIISYLVYLVLRVLFELCKMKFLPDFIENL